VVPYRSCGPRASSFIPLHCCLVLQLPHSMCLLGIFSYALPLLVDSKALSLLLFNHVSKIVVHCALPLLWIPEPCHYLLFSHVSKSWFIVLCHSCGFQSLIITYCLATLVNRGCSLYHFVVFRSFSCAPFCHVNMPWVSSLCPRNDYWGYQLFLCI